MSWSVQLIGNPENIAKALDEHSGTLSGQSKVEFDDAKPHLAYLVTQNFADASTNYVVPLVKLNASGSGSVKDGIQVQRSCTVLIEPFYSKLV